MVVQYKAQLHDKWKVKLVSNCVVFPTCFCVTSGCHKVQRTTLARLTLSSLLICDFTRFSASASVNPLRSVSLVTAWYIITATAELSNCVYILNTGLNCFSLSFNGHFPGGPVLLELKMFEVLSVVQSSSQIIITNKPTSNFFTSQILFLSPNCVKALKVFTD